MLGRVVLSLGLILPGIPAVAADIERGQMLADRWCSTCHVVGRSTTTGSADGLPTFPAIAAKPTTTADFLVGIMTNPHDRMPPLSLSKRDQDDLIAYILGLKTN